MARSESFINNGDTYWYLPSTNWYCFHRENGPAVEYADGKKLWWLNGERLPEKEIEEWIKENNITMPFSDTDSMAFKLRWL